ncbi:SDR family oxidoreductase [Brevundimonas sp.]|jgi:NAD(P)-dependent dehydrogenase (short-subunit alcohol dehydrogenase family)|uniref:SDR family oxidoreductase n=1 Tax=Brevundimonas sp. TaxID=1871086 RepID=UPI002E1652B3|nr:SDR family oxidoreductase [Brevundimonas sp.]
MRYSPADVPDQTGRFVIVTGGNGGTGFETAKVLATKGAEVLIAARDAKKGERAVQEIRRMTPGAQVRFERLDLSSQADVARFAEARRAEGRRIDVLINNAGIMALPKRQASADGHELQLATNFLGHFALTARLLPLLKGGRTVQLSSIKHRSGRIHLDDLNLERGYGDWKAYDQSKLAMLMFALELDRRSRANGWGVTSVAAHPGYARTGLIGAGPLGSRPVSRFMFSVVYRPFIEPLISHSAADGALPILMAATAPDVSPGGYYGPTTGKELKGPAGPVGMKPHARDEVTAAALWESAERLTGVRFG